MHIYNGKRQRTDNATTYNREIRRNNKIKTCKIIGLKISNKTTSNRKALFSTEPL